MKRKLMGVWLVFAIWLSLCSVAVAGDEMPWDGEGTAASPYLLATRQDIAALAKLTNDEENGRDFAGQYFKMTADITLPQQWIPVGTAASRFGGVFDGDGHTVTVPRGGLPLFGYVRRATVKNLDIYGVEIAGYGLVNNYSVDYGNVHGRGWRCHWL